MRFPSAFFRKAMKIPGDRSAALEVARSRLILVGAAAGLCYLFIGLRVVDIGFIQARAPLSDITAQAETEPLRTPPLQKVRADITDRNGVLLATSLETASLYADPALVQDVAAVAQDVVRALPRLSYGDVLQKLAKGGRFSWIARNLTPAEQAAVLALGHPGLNFKTEYRRIYPQEKLTAHIVGYADVDGKGLAGVERSFNDHLAQGDDALALTLDVRLQHVLRRELAKAVADFTAQGGAGVVMDVASGEILAAVSLPDFDPHDPQAAGTQPLFNNLTLGVFEQGSTFKIFSTAALLETRNVPLSQTFDVREPIKRGRFQIRDFHPENRVLTLPEVFMHSSNIGSALMGDMVGTKALKDFYSDLGFFEQLPLEIGEIGKPMIPDPWRDLDTLVASYGHGIAVTPLHTVAAAAGIVGDGTKVRPTVILDKSRREKAAKDGALRIVSPQTSHRMRQLMRLVVTEGTAKNADVPGYNVGGKTGTAQKNAGGKYDGSKRISSFLGFFPMNEPRYAVLVMVDEPKPNAKSYGYATGGWVAAPAVGRIITAMASILGVPPVKVQDEQNFAQAVRGLVHKASAPANNTGDGF